MSVDAEPVLEAHGLGWSFSLKGYSGHSLVRFNAGAAREKGLLIVPKPTPSNPAHTEVVGKKTSSIADHLRRSSHWVYLVGESA